jgi:hypothetical protein
VEARIMAAATNPEATTKAKRGLAKDHDIPIWFLIECVVWDKRHGKWRAQTEVDGRNIFLGLYDDILPAILIRTWAEHEFHRFRESPKPPLDSASIPPDAIIVTAAERWRYGVRRALSGCRRAFIGRYGRAMSGVSSRSLFGVGGRPP